MKDDDFKELVDSVGEQLFKWDHEYSLSFEKILTDNEKVLTDEQKSNLRWDVLLFRFRTINQLEQPNKPRFAPTFENTDGSVFPDIKEFDKSAFEYLRSRIDQVTNPIMKARYLDFIWEYGGKDNKFEIGKQLVATYLAGFEAYPHDNEIERNDSLYRAVFIATRLEKKKPAELTTQSVDTLKNYLTNLRKSENFRWIIDAIEIVIKQSDKFTKDELKVYAEYIEDGIQHYTTKDYNFMILQSLYELKLKLYGLIDPGQYSKTDLAVNIASELVKQAESTKDSTFMQQHYFGEAAQIYRDAGMVKESDQMVQKIKDLGQTEDYEKQFKVFSHEVAIPNEELDKLREVLGIGQKVPLAMGLSPHFVPSWQYAKKLADEMDGKFIAHKIFPTTTIGDKGYSIGTSASDPDSWTKQQYQIEASLKHTLLTGFMKEKLDKKEVHLSDFDKLFKKIKDIDQDTYDTVKHGLKQFFKKDYLSANMILTTQFEDFLRLLMPMFGLNSTMMHPTMPKAYTEKTLNRILDDCRPLLGENMFRLFEYVLIDRKMHYLRHKDAHGFVKLKDDNFHYCILIIQLYCYLLASLTKQKPKKVASP